MSSPFKKYDYLSSFVRFNGSEDIASTTLFKSSSKRNFLNDIKESFRGLSENDIQEIVPKNAKVSMVKCHGRISLIVIDGEPSFFQLYEGPLLPVLRLIHRYPNMLAKVQIDAGAIKHIISGSDIMLPGLISAGGKFPESLLKDQIVSVYSEGKEFAVAVGVLLDGAKTLIDLKRGIAVSNIHFLGDGLWKLNKV